MEKITCDKCGKKFKTEDSMSQHLNEAHSKQLTASPPKKSFFKRIGLYSLIFILIAGLLYGIYSLVSASITSSAVAASAGLPNNPIHWHPNLEIKVNGENIIIPANIGIGPKYSDSPHYDSMMRMTNMHTHDASGKLHWEVMMNAPRPEDMYLGNFFQVWGKTFNTECIFEYCNGPEGSMKMFVNGNPNYNFEKYMVRDEDKIEIVYE